MSFRIEIVDESGMVIESISTESYHLAYEEGDRVKTKSNISITFAIKHLGPHIMSLLGQIRRR